MDGSDVASDKVIAELLGMGFDFSDITKAVKVVGPSLDNAIEFIVNDSRRSSGDGSSHSGSHTNSKILGKRSAPSLQPSSKMRQQNITEHLKLSSGLQKNKARVVCNVSVLKTNILSGHVEGPEIRSVVDNNLNHCSEMCVVPYCKDDKFTGPEWEMKVRNLLKKHFGFSSLKSFQREALSAWLANQDSLVLAATGSGKSLCFQIPALLSGKVVIVISPLISLMHDQCLKLAKHGISACFLGSGQIDKSVELKAMSGAYSIIYVCPETILRLIKPLQSLAESCGIALFAIDEVHCVSKWGYDFRPDYRKLSVLREIFGTDIPLMALTATATTRVRQDILKSLHMSTRTEIVTTSFFRPNLRFSVKHSNTSASASYEKDFSELIELYTKKKISVQQHTYHDLKTPSYASSSASIDNILEMDEMCYNKVNDIDDDEFSDGTRFSGKDNLVDPDDGELSVQFLEDDYDQVQEVDDLGVSCGALCGESPKSFSNYDSPDSRNMLVKEDELDFRDAQGPLGEGSTIIYVPTRKETVSLAKFLSRFGVKAAAYNAKLPKSHLRQVHKEFHEDKLQVVVATIAFGMGIDKSNVRRIIHYGWPQSVEAYYQEAGRAGRDGELADCVLYANLSRIPTLLPNKRSEEQAKQAYKMLSDCFRYGMKTSLCRSKILVEYFGEQFTRDSCLICDVCTNGPPEIQNLKDEAKMLLQLVATHYENKGSQDYSDYPASSFNHRALKEKPSIRAFVSKIREQNDTLAASDLIWWRGLARVLEDRGFIREGDDMRRVQIKFPEITASGLQFLKSSQEEPFHVYPEADMVLSKKSNKPYSRLSEWGKGWADPEIRRQRLQRMSTRNSSFRKPRKSRKRQCNLNTVRGRLYAKLSK